MAEAEAAAEAEEPKPEKKKTPIMQSGIVKTLGWIALGAVGIGVVAVTAYYGSTAFRSNLVPTETPVGDEETVIGDPPETVELDPFVTILTDETGRPYSMKLRIKLTVNKQRKEAEEVKKELEARKDQLTDAVNEVLRRVDPKNFQLGPAKNQVAYNELRASITRAVNARMRNKIDGVLVMEFICQ